MGVKKKSATTRGRSLRGGEGAWIGRLRDAAVAVAREKERSRKSVPFTALECDAFAKHARWTRLDSFDRDGRHYLLAFTYDPKIPRPDALSARERQVLAAAARGQSNKVIANALGVTASTVGVLLLRAARKLSVTSRDEAIAMFRHLAGTR